MGLMDLFGKSKKTDAGLGVGGQPTAVDYVEWLLKHMLQTSRTELTIDTSRALPGSDQTAKEDSPPCIPDSQAIINRLKLLSGLNPVRHPSAVEGTFERVRTHHVIVVSTRFQDEDTRSVCSIRLRIRCQNA